MCGVAQILFTVIASQRVRAERGPMTGSAKQSRILPRKHSGLLRRFAPRNDDTGQALSFPRHDCARVVHQSRPSQSRGRRESRVLAAPAASCAVKKAHELVATGLAGTPDLPCAMVLTGSFVLSPVSMTF
jgi:hypothetical protein